VVAQTRERRRGKRPTPRPAQQGPATWTPTAYPAVPAEGIVPDFARHAAARARLRRPLPSHAAVAAGELAERRALAADLGRLAVELPRTQRRQLRSAHRLAAAVRADAEAGPVEEWHRPEWWLLLGVAVIPALYWLFVLVPAAPGPYPR